MAIAYELAVQEDLNIGVGTAVVTAPGGGFLTGTQIGLHSLAVGQLKATTTWSPGEVASGDYTSTTITVTGAALGDFVLASLSTMVTNDLMISAHVSAVNTVNVILYNPTDAAITPASGTLAAIVFSTR